MESAAYFEPRSSRPFDPAALVAGCLERGVDAILFDRESLPDEFFDLSSGLAGALLQKLVNYRIRAAVVVPDASIHSARFQELAREANRGDQCRFFANREEAVAWLELR